ncbi:diguanylate cyclase (GGDEF) domain protein [compost metagenome]
MLFCRFGGEEFALFAPRNDIVRAQAFAEVLRSEIAAMSVVSDGREIGVSVSIGLADVATFGTDFDRLHSAADSALYAAKEAGRNRTMCATPANALAGLAERMRTPAKPATGTQAAG